MKFNERARLDTSQVQDRRGNGGGGGGGGFGGGGVRLPRGKGGLAAGGGGIGLIVIVVIVLFNVFGGSGGGSTTDTSGGGLGGLLSNGLGAVGQGQTADNATLDQECRTGADANTNDACAAVAVINSVQAYWADALAASGTTYREADTVFYRGQTQTGCGTGSSGMGPFYCPADTTVYVDLTFWDDLRTQFGANDAAFTQAYVLAHEYGHHVQNLLGTSDQVGQATGPDSGSVRLELQADCYAGTWADHATTVPGADGEVLITEITDADIAAGVETAGKIGDDSIMGRNGGQVDTSRFSHGSAEQRQKWLTTGLQSGDPAACNTFDTADLG
ncbi:neutral zinc metallopeptidase [Nakamurella flavida]|uniref:Neutral zinc metallopeptidase n=1 Tax=Nakamurella flavida TaxID=363630 RepID=A0A938YMA4_9ACTN|nr:neutral zinc metallopeptidase [Nakamurella flavida]MBM9477834.1 neutral zinc metallopeptidase [Nakamurella flavida]MDP9779388.1 putative metalloprotease [Nakamurella flavida]